MHRVCIQRFAAAALLLTLLAAPCAAQAPPKLKLATATVDFGERWQGQPSETTVTLTNVGGQTLRIAEVKSDCGCTGTTVASDAIEPGQSTVLTVRYDTIRKVGPIQRNIHIRTNEPGEASHALNVVGNVKPFVSLSPSDGLNLGQLLRDDSLGKTILLRSEFTRPLRLRLRPLDHALLRAELAETQAGREWRLTIATLPPLREGPLTGDVLLETDVAEVPEVRIPISGGVAARVSVVPNRLITPVDPARPTERSLKVVVLGQRAVRVTGASASRRDVTVRVLDPARQSAEAGGALATELRVTLPPGLTPETAGTIAISTDDVEYATLSVPIVVIPSVPQSPPR